MASRTGMLEHVKALRWRDVAAALAETPSLLAHRDAKGRNWLHVCCDVDVAQRGLDAAAAVRTAGVLLDAGIDIDEPSFTKDAFRATPLWHAIARGGNVRLAKYLLGRGADPDHCIWAAVNRDSPALIRLLMESGAPDPTGVDASPLLAALAWNRFAAAKCLLELGADPNYRSADGRTALHVLLKKRAATPHVRMLVDNGARGDVKNADGLTEAEILTRRRDPALRKLGERLAAAQATTSGAGG